MILQRINRGAGLSRRLLGIKLNQYKTRFQTKVQSGFKPMVYLTVGLKLVMATVPVEAAVQGYSSISLEDTDPLSMVPLSGAGIQRTGLQIKVAQNQTSWSNDLITSDQTSLNSVVVGKSMAELEAEKAQQNAALAAKQKAELVAKEAAVQIQKAQTVAVSATESEIIAYIQAKFQDSAKVAIAVARAESGLNANSTHVNANRSIDRGIFQINSVHCNKVAMLSGKPCAQALHDYKFNIDYAYSMYKSSGWYPWSAYKNKSYQRFM